MGVIPAHRNLSFIKGATYRKRLTLLTGDAESDPEDLTNATASMTIYDRIGGTLLLELDDDVGITLGGEAGTIEISLSAMETDVEWKAGVYSLRLTYNGDTNVLLHGLIRAREY